MKLQRIQIHMNMILIVVALFMLSFIAAEGITCHQCYSVKKDNKCRKPSTCDVSKTQFCFIQRISRGGDIRKISQGCTSYCVDIVQFTNAFIKYTFCCRTDYCNKYNVWQFL
ncbi:acrosomal protein SP-10 [Python bivittatus]|uniref:Acrosomal protein SP-10 n=1 Tax=Python bivittatus TaxID=176946 RepID=A0A9F5IR87_PYTBI|nr:acrosomal protein SP-10 [Python bivittatus]